MPIGEFLIPVLMEWTADITVVAIRASGVPVYREGNFFMIPTGRWSVVEACSGLRYLIASFMVGCLFAYLFFRSAKRRWIFVGVSLLVPLVANWIRAYMIVMLGHLSDNRIAAGADHLLYGWVFFGVVMAILFWTGARWREDEPAAGAAESAPAARPASRRSRDLATAQRAGDDRGRAGIDGDLALAAKCADSPARRPPPARNIAPLPGAGGWIATTDALSDWRPDLSGATAELAQTFVKDGVRVGLYVALFDDPTGNAKAITSTNQLVRTTNKQWAQVGSGAQPRAVPNESQSIRTAVVTGNRQRLAVWQWYWVGWTHDRFGFHGAPVRGVRPAARAARAGRVGGADHGVGTRFGLGRPRAGIVRRRDGRSHRRQPAARDRGAMMTRSDDPRPCIVHVVYRFDVGGLENGLVNLVNHLPVDAYRHVIVALTEVTDFRTRIRRDDVGFVSLHKAPGHGVRLFPRLYRLLRELAPAIVHTRNLAALEATAPAWAAGVPVRIHGEHGRDVTDLDGSSRKYRLVRRAYRPFVSRYVALSRDLERYLQRGVGVAAADIAQIYNGVDTDRFAPAPRARPPIAGCPFTGDDLWLVGTVGRLQAVKDQVTLAEAFVRAVRRTAKGARLRLVIAGDGPLRAPVEAVLAAGGVSHQAWLPGERDDIPDVLRGLDCFVLPSLAEGISNTILEAMACGLPVVATRVGGNAELIEDGLTGRLVPAANGDSMADAIDAYFVDPATARRHARAARMAAVRNFSLQQMVSQYRSLYDGLLARGSPGMRTSAGG